MVTPPPCICTHVCATAQHVLMRATSQHVLMCATSQRVLMCATSQHVLVCATGQRVFSRVTEPRRCLVSLITQGRRSFIGSCVLELDY